MGARGQKDYALLILISEKGIEEKPELPGPTTGKKQRVDAYKDLDLVEQLGSGVPRILESYNRSCFTFTDNFLRMVLPINGGQVGGQVGHLTDRQKEVLDLIINDPSISRKALSEKLIINPSAIQKHIDALKKKGIISRESETTGFWEIHINNQAED